MKLRLAALTVLSTSLLMPAAANAGGHTVDKFMKADTDQSGAVSKDEYMKKYQDKFTKMDSNSDENVSPDEFEAYMASKYEEKRKEKFNKMDKDGDGMLSPEEMSDGMKSWKHKH